MRIMCNVNRTKYKNVIVHCTINTSSAELGYIAYSYVRSDSYLVLFSLFLLGPQAVRRWTGTSMNYIERMSVKNMKEKKVHHGDNERKCHPKSSSTSLACRKMAKKIFYQAVHRTGTEIRKYKVGKKIWPENIWTFQKMFPRKSSTIFRLFTKNTNSDKFRILRKYRKRRCHLHPNLLPISYPPRHSD